MGGFGSGRKSLRPAFEASLRIDLSTPQVKALVDRHEAVTGRWTWSSSGQAVGAVRYVFVPVGMASVELTLAYAVADIPNEQTIQLNTTRPHFGGLRWWFVCPAFARQGTRRLVRCICLPSGASAFASRAAHRLNYQSQKDSRDLLRSLGGWMEKYG
jgi:hypothetical protein